MSAVVQAVKHSLMWKISIACILLVISGLFWAIYSGIIRPIIKPNPTQTNNAQTIIINYYYPNKKTFGIGFSIGGMDFGAVKYVYPDKPTTVNKIEIKK